MTFQEHSLFQLEEKPAERIALKSDEGLILTYGDLVSTVQEFQHIQTGNRLVICVCENHPGAVAGYLALLENRLVPLLLSSSIGDAQFRYYYSSYEPGYIWASMEWLQMHPEYNTQVVLRKYGYCLVQTGYESGELHPDLALLLTTSGSTGNAKLVRLSRENIRSNAQAIVSYLQIDETERPISTLPMNYTYGLSVVHSHILAGACMLLTRCGYVQNEFWQFFETEQATSISGVPYTYEILKRLRMFRNQLPSLRTLTQAGGHLSEALQQEVAEWAIRQGANFYIMYGQTEATARMAYLPPGEAVIRTGSIGKAIPGGAFHLENEDGSIVTEVDLCGELVYTGPNVSLGYASCRKDLQLGDINQGVLHTGDLARCDQDGYYYIVGRKKRFVKLFGTRVSLDACEGILRDRFPGQEIVCAGSDDALHIYTTAEQELADQMAQLLSETLGVHWKAFEGFSVYVIPKNEAGKIQYHLLNGERCNGDSK